MAEASFKVGETKIGGMFCDEEWYEELPDAISLTMPRQLFNVIHHLHQICKRYNLAHVARYTFDVPIDHEWLSDMDDGTQGETTCRIDCEQIKIYPDGEFRIVAWQKNTGMMFSSPRWALEHG